MTIHHSKTDEEHYLRLAITLASRAMGRTSPNPLVGAVIVKGCRIVGKGYHRRAGTPHAEMHALAEAGRKATGADLYVNLEPCCHHGRTPPCTDAIIQAGIRRVFIGIEDPNPLVGGKGIRKLKKAGVRVKTGILEESCRKLNEVFIKHVTTGHPFVLLKAASSLDGRIAAVGGDSKWITNEKSRQFVHRLRNQVDAVLVGLRTVVKDDPMLTVRLRRGGGCDPTRIIVDSTLKISPQAKVFNPLSKAPTIVATTARAPARRIKEIEKRGGQVLVIPSPGRVNLPLLMGELGKQEITSVLIEGGERINTSALHDGIVDKVVLFFAPRILGGTKAPMFVGGKGVSKVGDGLQLKRIKTRRFGDDVMIEGYL